MARYRRYRRTIIRAPKKKWGSNIVAVSKTVTASAGFATVVLASNSTESLGSPTPVVVKTGNFKLQADMRYDNTTVSMTGHPKASLYIIFVPQGMVPTTSSAAADLIQNHPEWIMAWRLLESTYVANTAVADTTRFTLSSRLKRNLNSGDAVYAIILASGLSSGQTCVVDGLCQFWTCAN